MSAGRLKRYRVTMLVTEHREVYAVAETEEQAKADAEGLVRGDYDGPDVEHISIEEVSR